MDPDEQARISEVFVFHLEARARWPIFLSQGPRGLPVTVFRLWRTLHGCGGGGLRSSFCPGSAQGLTLMAPWFPRQHPMAQYESFQVPCQRSHADRTVSPSNGV